MVNAPVQTEELPPEPPGTRTSAGEGEGALAGMLTYTASDAPLVGLVTVYLSPLPLGEGPGVRAQSAGQFWAFSGPSQMPLPQGELALPGVGGCLEAVGDGRSRSPAGVAVAVAVGTWGGDAVSAGVVVAEGVGVPVSEQARTKNSKRGKSNFLIGASYQGFGCAEKNSQINCEAEMVCVGSSPPCPAGPALPGQACLPPTMVYSSTAVPSRHPLQT